MHDVRPEEIYFQAWSSHKAQSISTACITDLLYRRDGKDPIIGTTMLEDYWKKNAARQRNLRLDWLCIAQGKTWGVYIFTSQFFDSEEQNEQLVFGQIIFQLNEAGKIYEIYEKYEKINDFEVPDIKQGFQDNLSKLKSIFHPVRRYRLFTKVVKSLFRGAIGILAIAAVLYMISLITDGSKPVLPWKTDNNALLWEDIERAFGKSIAFSAIVLFFLQIAYKKLSVGNAMRLHSVTDFNSVPDILSKYLNGASKAVIFIGDGRNISNNSKLIERLKNIDKKNSLTVVSDRGRTELFAAVQKDRLLNDLLVRLESRGKLHFGSRYLKTELAYIETDGISVALDMSTTSISALFGVERNKSLLSFIKELSDELYSPRSDSTPELNDTRSRIIILCGKPHSGKSTLGMRLRDFGYVIIEPESYDFEEVFQELYDSSADKVEFLDDDTNAELFCNHIMDSLFQAPKIVIDSLKTPALVKVLRRQIPQKGTLVFLDACDDIIIERLTQNDCTKTKAKAILKKYDNHSMEGIKREADLILSGEASEEVVFNKMKEYLRL